MSHLASVGLTQLHRPPWGLMQILYYILNQTVVLWVLRIEDDNFSAL